nr:hypothetical protein [Tanacetum cinerariifolium]
MVAYLTKSDDNDVTRLQALVDKKKVVVTEAAIREVLRLDDAKELIACPTKRFLQSWHAWVRRSHPQSSHFIKPSSRASGRVETPLFEGMLVGQVIEEGGDAEEHVEDVTAGDAAQGDDNAAHGKVSTVSQEPSIPSPTPHTPPPQPPQDPPSTSQKSRAFGV